MTSRADQGKQPFWGPGQPLVVDQWSSQFGAAEVPVHRNLQDLARRAKSCKIPRTTTRNLDRISTAVEMCRDALNLVRTALDSKN